MSGTYKDLEVWRAAMVFAATALFPKEERYGLTSQLRRAAVSNWGAVGLFHSGRPQHRPAWDRSNWANA